MEYSTKSDEETKQIGRDFAKQIRGGGVIFLYGNLGAGKTTFVKGVAEGLGLKNRILSPTFTIFRQYPLNEDQTLYHIDLYRAEGATDIDSLGLSEFLENPNNILFIEWPENVSEKLATHIINITRLDETHRTIVIELLK